MVELGSAVAHLDLDATGFTNGLRSAASKLDSTAGAVSEVNAALQSVDLSTDKWQSSLTSTVTAMGKMENTAQGTQSHLSSMSGLLSAISSNTQDTTKEISNLVNELKEMNNQTDKSKKPALGLSDLFKSGLGAQIAADCIRKATEEVGQFIVKGIELASNLSEVQNVVDVTFGESASQIYSFAETATESFGVSKLSAEKFTGTLGALFKSMGVSSDATLEMSTALTGLAGDMASFYNLNPQEAFDKLRAGISGEAEPLKQLGVNMSVANLEAYALSQGIETAFDSMTQAEQATLRYNFIMQATADAQGDFARTSDSYANQQRLMGLAMENAAAIVGEKLIPALNNAFKEGRNLLESDEFTEVLEEIGADLGDLAATVIPATIKAIKFLVNHSELLIAAGVSVVAGMTASKAAVIGNTIATAASAVSTEGLTVAEYALAVAQGVLNATMLANPIVLVTAALAGLAALTITTVINAQKEHARYIEEQTAKSREFIDAANATKQALDDSTQAVSEASAAVKEKTDTMGALTNQLANYVDASGKVTGSETELKNIIERINEIAPNTISLIDGQIAGYETLATTIAAVTEQMRLKAELEAGYGGYTDALKTIEQTNEVIESNKTALSETNDFLSQINDYWNNVALQGEDAIKASELYKNTIDQAIADGADESIASWENWLMQQQEIQEMNKQNLFDALGTTVEGYNQALEIQKDYIKKQHELAVMSAMASGEIISDQTLATIKVEQDKAKALAALNKEQGEKHQKELDESLKTEMESLEYRKNVHLISEEQYYASLGKYLQNHTNKGSELWNKYNDGVVDYEKKKADTAAKALEDQKKADEQAVKQAQANADKKKAVAEKAQKEQEEAQKKLFKEQEDAAKGAFDKLKEQYTEGIISREEFNNRYKGLVKSWGGKFVEVETSVQKQITEIDKQEQDARLKQVEKSTSDAVAVYEKQVSDIQSKIDTFRSNMDQSLNEFYKTTEGEDGKLTLDFGVSGLDTAIAGESAKLQQYDKLLDQLEKKGAGQALIEQIQSLGLEEGMALAKKLSEQSDSELKSISDRWQQYQNLLTKTAASRYETELKTAQTTLIDTLNASLASKDLQSATLEGGKQIIAKMIEGIDGKKEELKTSLGMVETSVGETLTKIETRLNSLINSASGMYGTVSGGLKNTGTTPTTGVNGSHAGGLDYVPYDGYIAELHKGERVMTAGENAGKGNSGGGNTFVQNIYSNPKASKYELKKDAENLLDLKGEW